MNITLNGENREVLEGITLSALLIEFELSGERIAVERNGDIIRKADYSSTMLKNSDKLEIVRFVGGG